jgi:hypothetical protein
MHKGHGGGCGNTVWHGAIFPERDDSLTFFDEDKLGYLRCLPDAHPEFKDYKVEWEKPWMKDVSKWMNSATAREKTMGTKYSELVFGPWRDVGIDQNQQIEIVRWLLGPNEDNTRVNSKYVEEEGENSGDDSRNDGDGSAGASGAAATDQPGAGSAGASAAANDQPGDNANDTEVNDVQMDLAVSKKGSLKRVSKDIAIEQTTKNTKQRLMRAGPSKTTKSQPKPKMVVEMETGGKNMLFFRAGNSAHPEGVPSARLKEPPPAAAPSVAGEMKSQLPGACDV